MKKGRVQFKRSTLSKVNENFCYIDFVILYFKTLSNYLLCAIVIYPPLFL